MKEPIYLKCSKCGILEERRNNYPKPMCFLCQKKRGKEKAKLKAIMCKIQ